MVVDERSFLMRCIIERREFPSQAKKLAYTPFLVARRFQSIEKKIQDALVQLDAVSEYRRGLGIQLQVNAYLVLLLLTAVHLNRNRFGNINRPPSGFPARFPLPNSWQFGTVLSGLVPR